MTMTSSRLENLCKTVRKRPGMFLPVLSPGRPMSPSLMFASFLYSIFDDGCLSKPKSIKVGIAGEHCLIHAEDCYVNLANLIRWDDSLFVTDPLDGVLQKIWPINQEREFYAPFLHTIALVCLSSFCQLDVSFYSTGHFREFFFNGKQITNLGLIKNEDTENNQNPYCRMTFIPSMEVFGKKCVEANELLEVLDKLIAKFGFFKYEVIDNLQIRETNFMISITP